jgi:predicted nucleic acid-binding protein
MSFLLDTDTCSAYVKNHRGVQDKVVLHFGALYVSVVTAGELLT